ncbi:MAG: PTS sugar transporter subunit IIB [Methylococcaceae bacterium]|nr:PTS sugar transporter subunit IIB [Prolixibacteraceae bacterium]
MIGLLRIDDRLLHGQVALTWTPSVGAGCILVANDKVAADDFQKMALNLAKPANVKLLVKSIADTAAILNDARYNGIKMLVLVNSVKDAFSLSELVSDIKSVNFGGIRSKEGSKAVSKAISLTDSDIAIIRKMLDKGLELEIRQVPGDKKLMLDEVI